MYDKLISVHPGSTSFKIIFQCDCSVQYDDILFHVFGHHVKQTENYIQALMADYIREHGNDIDDIAKDFLKKKKVSH